MNKRILWAFVFLLSGTSCGLWAAEDLSVPNSEATLSSDQMELITKGNKAVFTGHVVLDRPPYQLKANKMIRTEETGLVEAEGHIRGNWQQPAGGKLETTGEHGRYDPKTQEAELWTDPNRQVTVDWKDERGSGHFLSDRAFLTVVPKRVRLIDHVTGHIVPAKP